VSDNMWTHSVGVEEFSVVDVHQTFFTLIPSRFPTIDVFARVANDRSRELAELESLTNPRLRERDRLLHGAQVVDGNGPLLQNWNHAPFTYHNPEGSRFYDPGQPVLELASDMQTALAISIRKRETFLSRTGEAATDCCTARSNDQPASASASSAAKCWNAPSSVTTSSSYGAVPA